MSTRAEVSGRKPKRGAPNTADPATEAKRLVRDRLTEKHGSLHAAAAAAEPRMTEQKLRRWLFQNPDSMDFSTEQSFKSLGVRREELRPPG